MKICDYGCGQEAKHIIGKKFCCSTNTSLCPAIREKISNATIGNKNGGFKKGNVAWNEGKTKENNEIVKKMGDNLKERYKKGELIPYFKGRKHTEETKNKIRQARIKFLTANPDKIPWNRKNNLVSEPCEHFKRILTKENLDYVEEYRPLDNRFYHIDISFPDKKLGIEINGTQHYNTDGTLAKYYDERHKLIECAGWTLIEIPFKYVYVQEKVDDILKFIKSNAAGEINYMPYKHELGKYRNIKCSVCEKTIVNNKSGKCWKCLYPNPTPRTQSKPRTPRKEYRCKVCGILIKSAGKTHQCAVCYKKSIRKVDRPSLETIQSQLKELGGYCAVGRFYGVTDNCIRKWEEAAINININL